MDYLSQEGQTGTSEDLSSWLDQARAGDRAALDRAMVLVYGEVRRMAEGMRKAEPDGLSLQATEIANAVYIRLTGTVGLTFENRACFLGLASTAMRHFLTDHAKSKRREKRGGGLRPIPLDDALHLAAQRNLDIEALDEALADLEMLNERHARVIEHRVFGGLSVEESAAALGVSPTTVKREFAAATKWLQRRLRGAADGR